LNATQLTVVRSGLPLPTPAAGELVVSDDEVRGWVRDGRLFTRIGRYRVSRLVTERLSTSGRPMLMWALRLVARRCYIVDSEGRERPVTFGLLTLWSWAFVRDAALRPGLLRRIRDEVDAIALQSRPQVRWNRSAPVLYLRTDLSFGVRAGGSVGHIAGVLNGLADTGGPPPIMLTTAPVPTVRDDVETHIVAVPEAYWNFAELPALALNDVLIASALEATRGRAISFVYQRYSVHNYSGLQLARRLRVPFVLEYNGSELWMSRHWSRRLNYEELAERIELLNVQGADLVVVVSRAMRDELAARSIDAARIVVNPNGVDPDRYTPSIDGTAVAGRLGLAGKTVVGFISTFQPWHGAQVLVHAFARLIRENPGYVESVRLLMIGTGPELPALKRIVEDTGLGAIVHFTGLVEQEAGPEYLAACDILASPHVPNADGSPFFGSPTKLFEYMAMGKAIVASDLDQIGEVLRHGETAWMVPPADVAALADGMKRLVADPQLRTRLGAAARADVVVHHTWGAHVMRTLDALEARIDATAA
jgi:glycosyltransferase involved in cell wall biosynthesis